MGFEEVGEGGENEAGLGFVWACAGADGLDAHRRRNPPSAHNTAKWILVSFAFQSSEILQIINSLIFFQFRPVHLVDEQLGES